MEAYSILTCKLNKNTINCFDGTYPKEQLKKWAMKNILLCPVCCKPYEYCHGRIATPYFRHKDKQQCDYLYHEPETLEHIKGKQMLYEWISKQEGVSDVVLEGWIPETKQRPDIMFKYDHEQYVIEFQCSPIASKYLERHDLYKAGGINDIWILGTEKFLGKTHREKSIQDNTIYYLDVSNETLMMSSFNKEYSKPLRNCLQYKIYSSVCKLYCFDLSSLYFDNSICIDESSFAELIKEYEKNSKIENERKRYCKGIFEETLMKIIEVYPSAVKSNYHGNSIEIGWFNLFVYLDPHDNVYSIELKKRNFNKVKYKAWNGKKMANRSKWECRFANINIQHFHKCTDVSPEKIIEFVIDSLNEYKGVESI